MPVHDPAAPPATPAETGTETAQLAAPYSLLGPHYDAILGHYRRGFEAVRDHVLRQLAPPRPGVFCDLGCGTGTGCLQLAWRGWRVHGVDASPAMLACARAKADLIRRAPPAILSWLAAADHQRLRRLTPARAQACLRQPLHLQFHRADFRDFRLPEPADFLTCLFDSINHLPDRRELLPALRQIHANLAPGGYALIDANSPRAIREVWPAMKPEIHADPAQGYYALLQGGAYDPARRCSSMHWTWFLRESAAPPEQAGQAGAPAAATAPDGAAGDRWIRRVETYREVAWTRREWSQTVRRAGLRLESFRDAGDLDPGFDPGWRWVLLLTRPST